MLIISKMAHILRCGVKISKVVRCANYAKKQTGFCWRHGPIVIPHVVQPKHRKPREYRKEPTSQEKEEEKTAREMLEEQIHIFMDDTPIPVPTKKCRITIEPNVLCDIHVAADGANLVLIFGKL